MVMTDAISAAQSALGAMSTSMAVTANNVANLDTNEFKSSEAQLATGPDGHGVQVSTIAEDTSSGGVVPESMSAQDGASTDASSRDLVEASNVDLVRQMINMMEDSRAFEANTKVIRTEDDMAGTLLDMRV
jgi:flagellar basal-body rod protein FlgC